MKFNTDTLYIAFAGGLMSGITYLVGGIDKLVTAFVLFMVCDFITGIISNWGKVGSKRAFRGLGKKGAMIILVIIAVQLDYITGNEGNFMRNAMLMFLIGTEGISILENLARLGVKFPPFIKNALEQLRDDSQRDVKK